MHRYTSPTPTVFLTLPNDSVDLKKPFFTQSALFKINTPPPPHHHLPCTSIPPTIAAHTPSQLSATSSYRRFSICKLLYDHLNTPLTQHTPFKSPFYRHLCEPSTPTCILAPHKSWTSQISLYSPLSPLNGSTELGQVQQVCVLTYTAPLIAITCPRVKKAKLRHPGFPCGPPPWY